MRSQLSLSSSLSLSLRLFVVVDVSGLLGLFDVKKAIILGIFVLLLSLGGTLKSDRYDLLQYIYNGWWLESVAPKNFSLI